VDALADIELLQSDVHIIVCDLVSFVIVERAVDHAHLKEKSGIGNLVSVKNPERWTLDHPTNMVFEP